MSSRKRLIADLLFWIQVIGIAIACGSQFFRLLETVEGISLSMFLLNEAYFLMSLLLAMATHKAQASRITWQTTFVYVAGPVFIGTLIAAIIINGSYRWGFSDNITILLTVVGIAAIALYGKSQSLSLQDPMLKSFLAMLFRSLPQLFFAWKIYQEGGAGTPGVTILVGNIIVLIRIGQLGLSVKEAGWDRNRKWLLVSEISNEISWATASIIWLIWVLT